MLSNAYFLAKFRFDTAENEPAKNLQNFAKFANFADPNPLLRHDQHARPRRRRPDDAPREPAVEGARRPLRRAEPEGRPPRRPRLG